MAEPREPRPFSQVNSSSAGRDTQLLLKAGSALLAAGFAALLLTKFFFGGFGPHGADTNTGWVLLVVAAVCIPLGGMVFALGAAKWLRDRRR
jgi:hypothetical protein